MRSKAPRTSNPFSTRYTKPGELEFIFENHATIDSILTQFFAMRRGAIIGPHGSGKSTLLHQLAAALRAQGHEVVHLTLHDGQRSLPMVAANHSAIVFIDGYEQLGWPARWRLRIVAWLNDWAILVTSHAPTRHPTLFQTTPSASTLERLADLLLASDVRKMTQCEISAAYAFAGGNLREALFRLYDRYDQPASSAASEPAGVTSRTTGMGRETLPIV